MARSLTNLPILGAYGKLKQKFNFNFFFGECSLKLKERYLQISEININF